MLGFSGPGYLYLRIYVCLADKLLLWVYVSVRGTRMQLWGSSSQRCGYEEGLGQGGCWRFLAQLPILLCPEPPFILTPVYALLQPLNTGDRKEIPSVWLVVISLNTRRFTGLRWAGVCSQLSRINILLPVGLRIMGTLIGTVFRHSRISINRETATL